MFNRYYFLREWIKTFLRSNNWSDVRDLFLTRFDSCECCGVKTKLNVHHILPVKWYPDLELQPYNLITLCRRHHFEIGHFGNWKNWNPNIREMAKNYKESFESQQYIQRQLVGGDISPEYIECVEELKREFLYTKGYGDV